MVETRSRPSDSDPLLQGCSVMSPMKPEEMFSNQALSVAGHGRNPMKAQWPIEAEGESAEWDASLQAVQKRVPPTHWQIFEMYLMENRSSRQVAEQFNTSHYNVRVISHRIRKRVEEHLASLRDSQTANSSVTNGSAIVDFRAIPTSPVVAPLVH